MFDIYRDIDPRRPELFVVRKDSRWVVTNDGYTLVINSVAEARELVEALMEETMRLNLIMEDEDA